jgi:S-adenosylmethionine:tRNA ribosyltransferase-isomerase
MLTSDFDFTFPEGQIAVEPLPRGAARMLVAGRAGGDFLHSRARLLPDFLSPGDALVLNDTKVLRARLVGETPLGQRAEVLLLGPRPEPDSEAAAGGMRWEAMVKPAKRFRIGDRIAFPPRLSAEVIGLFDGGTRLLRFNLGPDAFHQALEVTGRIPLPPYIRREARPEDDSAYQSVFAERPGSVAAPTASLHLDEGLLREVASKGVDIRKVTLHVGAGTFKPVQTEEIEGHVMHAERYELPAETAEALNAVRARGGRIWAVGTTVARVLETCGLEGRSFRASSGETRIFIRPGHAWKAVDGLLTNFHWPRSTLFMLVCSLLGTERAKQAYSEAFAEGYRLFSYGDAMLITPA